MKAAFSFFKAALPPTVTSANWAIVDTHGGTAITLTGTRFTGATGVTFGGTACTSVVVVGPTSITCVTPVKAAGTYDFVVTTPSGTGTLAGAVEAWYPTQITSVFAVYDSELNVTQSSNAVSQWNDQVGNYNVVQATAGRKPVYTSNVFGSRHSLHFTVGNISSLSGSVWHNLAAPGNSIFAVMKTTSTNTTSTYAGDAPATIVGDSSNNINQTWGMSNGQIFTSNFNSGGWHTDVKGSGLNDGTAHLVGMTHKSASTFDVKAYLGATQQGATNTGMTAYATATVGFNSIGRGFNTADCFDGDLGLVVVVADVISAGDLTKLNNFCKSVWGTP